MIDKWDRMAKESSKNFMADIHEDRKKAGRLYRCCYGDTELYFVGDVDHIIKKNRLLV